MTLLDRLADPMIRTKHIDVRAEFPAIPEGWHYLDSAATAQKPLRVIEVVNRAYSQTYASVHRGVYARSADMTRAYEDARREVADFLHAKPEEIVFTRGATEAINLVAQSWGGANLKPGDRIMLSQLEHHSNIVPWQMIAERTGAEIDAAPLDDTGCIDLDWIEESLTERHKIVALSHVSNALGSVLDARRAARIAHARGTLLLLDGCQAAARIPVDVRDLGCDFYAVSGHKMYGPTGIGALWARAELLDSMPPVQGGGAMIDRVSFAGTTYAPAPGRFEAGTPHITGALGLAEACRWMTEFGMGAVSDHESALVEMTRARLTERNSVRVFGPPLSAGIVSFAVEGVHPHDVATILDEEGVAIRAGHHCAQPLMESLGVEATARASFGIYSGQDDVDALMRGLDRVAKVFG